MKGKILTQGMGLISPNGFSSRVERSNSGYSLTNSGVLLVTDDDNSITNDHSNEADDDLEVTEWCMDDFTPCASRSTSFYRGFFDSTHEKLSAAGLFKRPFQTGLCITLALGFISGILGLFLGGLLASWNEDTCTEALDLSSKWQQVFTDILSKGQSRESPAISKFLENSSISEIDREQLIQYLNSYNIWNSVAKESMSITVYQPFSANLSIPNQPRSGVVRYLDMEPSLGSVKPYYYGALEDIGSCQNLGLHLLVKRQKPTILLCGYSMPLETVPLLSAEGVHLVMIFNRSSIPDTLSMHPKIDKAHASFRQLPVPYIVIKTAVPNLYYSNPLLLSIRSMRKVEESTIIKAIIKGTLVEEELIVVAVPTTSTDSVQLADSMIASLDLLVQRGWQPLRTIIFVFWNGKRTVMENWIKQNSQTFSIRLKTFIDVTNPIEGVDTFAVVGSLALKQAAFVASKMVMSHHHDSFTLYDRWDNCISERLPFDFSVPRMDYPQKESIANLVQTLTNSAVISMQYKNLPNKDRNQHNTNCMHTEADSNYLSRPALLDSLARVVVRFLIATSGDPILPFNILDITHALQVALPAESESEVRSILKQLQIEATHIHAFLDFTVSAEQISLDEASSLNTRLFFAFNALEDIFVRFGNNLERLKEAVNRMKSSEDQLPEELLDINKRILESIKSCLKNGLELLSAEYT